MGECNARQGSAGGRAHKLRAAFRVGAKRQIYYKSECTTGRTGRQAIGHCDETVNAAART
jgi:hypothetical protein